METAPSSPAVWCVSAYRLKSLEPVPVVWSLVWRTIGERGTYVMKNRDRINPKIDPAPNSNTEKEPDDWVSGDNPMTGAQASYLKTLSEECGEDNVFQADLTKAEASKRIDALKEKRRPARNR